MTTARNGQICLEYERFGPHGGIPLLLISGTGVQMLIWPEEFCDALVGRGFQVARFDNRDSGLSTHLEGLPVPSMFAVMLRPASAPYRLADLAGDAVAVLDALGWPAAHIVGASLGGMVAQELALRHPARVLTLTSIMSTSSARIATIPTKAAMKAIKTLDRMPVHDAHEAGERAVALKRVLGAGGYPLDEDSIREIGRRSYLRCPDDDQADRRQRAAVMASGDRRKRLTGVRVPALVIHGRRDPVIGVKGGRSTAQAIPGARLRIFPELAHDLPSAVWPAVIDEIAALASAITRSGA
jgi:pimeloyl-ACP methyl ester carboxylesterase